jgi:uncharacterized protein YbjT (DUF2867 family)
MGARASNTALVFGATGYTGNAVVKHWSAIGNAVAHVRPDSRHLAKHVANFQQCGAKVEQVPWEEGAIFDLVERVAPSVVFSLLGTTRARAKTELSDSDKADPYAAVDERLTLQVLRAVVAKAPTALFVYLSALGVSETSQNSYLLARYRVEKELADSGLRCIVARPAFITGTDRAEFRMGERAVAVAADGILGALARTGVHGLKNLRNKFASLTGDELARALVSLARKPPREREVFPDVLRKHAVSD